MVDPEETQTTKAFHSLHWGTEYCVSVKVEGVGSLSASRPSKQCLQLPEQGKKKKIIYKSKAQLRLKEAISAIKQIFPHLKPKTNQE